MGNYNPYAPQILGQEWVPIRDEDLFLTPVVNTVETGHGFTLATSRTLSNGRFYLHEFPSSDAVGQVFQIAVYNRGQEDLSGPIESVIIPCNNGGVTGNAIITGANVADALADPSDGNFITLSGGTPDDANADLYFATNQYAQLLNGKRVVALNFLYSATSSTLPDLDFRVQVIQPALTDGITYGTVSGGTVVAPESGPGRPVISRITLGEVSPFFSNTPTTTVERLPWVYADLQRFEISHSGRITVRLDARDNAAGLAIFFLYAALEVIYCEEQRLAVSGVAFGPPTLNSGAGTRQRYVYGTNIMTMRSMSTFAASPVLPVGNYTLVLSSPETGMERVKNTPYPILNAVRQLYAIPPHPGIQVNIPKPAEDHLGDTFTQTVSMILPQISLHASGGTLTEPHVYGRNIAAQVYGANSATQDIYDDITGTAATYQQTRFYARRFGDTSVPLTMTGVGGLSASTVAITPAEFDALTDIVDGWKEVTLTFATPPSMGAVAGLPAWTWSAVGETAGNRWEILGACAPAISGVPGNLLNPILPTTDRLGTATYQPILGDTTELTWMPQGCSSPYVSGASADPAVDAVLLFSQNPNAVTGVALSQLTQTVTGLGFNCGSLPCCIPSGIGYNRVTWGLPVNTGVASDDFNRTVAAGGWGTASDGHTWTTSGTAANFSVDGAEGLIAPTATASDRIAWVDVGGPEQDVQAQVKVTDTAETSSLNIGLVARLTDASNYYGVEFRQNSTGTTTLLIRKRVAGVATDLLSMTVPLLNPSTTAWRNLRFQVQGTILRAKVWGVDEDEPEWMLSISDSSLTTGNNAGAFARDNTTAAAPSTFQFDQFTVGPPDYGFGALELQRFDYLTGIFETIMLATSPTVTGFNDYEARVGIDSVYRIRNLNVYNFAGPWSTQVTGAPPVPGVTGGCSDNTGALIFTSNADQSGHSNAAYVMQWDGAPDETFDLPEGDDVVFQPMYGRDGRVAFHGTERGLETFNRTLLIHAAAIDPIRLADVKTLRDLAWADLPYICVRDELGDRWYANVRIPTVSARQNRTQYMARVGIVETTTSPYAVNP